MKKQNWFKRLAAGLVIGGVLLATVPATIFAAETTTTTPAVVQTMKGYGARLGQTFGSMLDSIAKFLGIDTTTLITERQSGKSLAQIAKEKGKSETDLVNFIVKERTAQLDQLVKDGKITQAQADLAKSQMVERVKAHINKTTVGGNGYGKGRGMGQGKGQFRGQGRGQAGNCIYTTPSTTN
ncbi:hypothetical protein [Carboxydothermus ferrireducens]|uniref:DUF2680 domain-containing protein n=1 Tax=Carboxydothermus ferrireducens DSM 11255 TaxID=1119529 RepID=A0ABX2RFJ7_9THEO|nr:hypothetical protein [Carboxydothermus ferrireducens]NYE58598.1 hypothetical protein [Carboxydothermus ferrireducens DSM 11255]